MAKLTIDKAAKELAVKQAAELKAAKAIEKKEAAEKVAKEKEKVKAEKETAARILRETHAAAEAAEKERIAFELASQPKPSVREYMELESLEIIAETEKLIPRLEALQAFALKNKRPSKHFYAFQVNLHGFVRVFKKMLR